MRAHDEALYWMRDDSWSRVNTENDCLELTPKAPQRAIESFRLYLRKNGILAGEEVVPGQHGLES